MGARGCEDAGAKAWGEGCCGPQGTEQAQREQMTPPLSSSSQLRPAIFTCKGFRRGVELALAERPGEEQGSSGDSGLGHQVPWGVDRGR